MNRFADARQAKEFLVGQIVAEAQIEGVLLSEVERKMLYFSETDWAPDDIMETSDKFDEEYDQQEYEEKISALARNARQRARETDKQKLDAWEDAIRILREEDHYILVMIE